ncbi:hypothetical protein [Sphingobium sp. D43FB]|uniref:hypothetical protein n=1 Tax=Sphingobium sp. D43FB TaxID=2017595 RepID=UPI000BB557F2|nr:hypothetical protein [Sphingobium sp. D43FB]PBN41667.1 hypothetical protein SxD43FB_20635 [Sphingobium sp. D43FB]
MEVDDAHLILRIETKTPVELSDFVSAFVGFGSQFERFHDREYPEETGGAGFFVREVRAGSIIAELVPYIGVAAVPVLGGVMTGVKHANDLKKFVENYGATITKYFKRGGRELKASKGDLNDFHKTVRAVAHDSDANLSLAVFEDGEQRVAFEFDTAQAREAEHNILEHRQELERTTAADHEKVLMVFTKTGVAHAKTGKRSGETVQIEAIHPRALPIVYASTLAEERIRHEIAEADDNVYKKAFDVDVNVELRGGKPIAYRLVAVHDVIDLPDED